MLRHAIAKLEAFIVVSLLIARKSFDRIFFFVENFFKFISDSLNNEEEKLEAKVLERMQKKQEKVTWFESV